MNRQPFLVLLFSGTLAALSTSAGTLNYAPIPSTESDAQSGINTKNVYTSAVDGGNTTGSDRVVNGVTFYSLIGAVNSCAANNVTLSVASGTLANDLRKAEVSVADGEFGKLHSDWTINSGADDQSEQYIILDPASLTAGKNYDLRIYIGKSSEQNRTVKLSFAGDGKPAVSTDFFNEDDATTSAGGFSDPNQAYYISYRFTWDGETMPGVTITQTSGSAPFLFYALTNQEATDGAKTAAALETVPGAEDSTVPLTAATDQTENTQAEDDHVGVSSDEFYNAESLTSHGRWVEVGAYGRCWQPTEVDNAWRPYTVGCWRHSFGNGWVWDSEESWGWCTYHYGRWIRLNGIGWCWVPGKVWAPSWCSWRFGNGYCGWAPLPPEATCNVNAQISTWADATWEIGPGHYNFCNIADFGAPSMASVLIDRRRYVEIIRRTTNITNIIYNGRRVFSGGPKISVVNAALLRASRPGFTNVKIEHHYSHEALTKDGRHSLLSGEVLSFASPRIATGNKALHLPVIAATFKDPKVIDHGWNAVEDHQLAEELHHKIALETGGPLPKDTRPSLTNGATGKTGNKLVFAKPGESIKKDEFNKKPKQLTKPGDKFVKTGETLKKTTDAVKTKASVEEDLHKNKHFEDEKRKSKRADEVEPRKAIHVDESELHKMKRAEEADLHKPKHVEETDLHKPKPKRVEEADLRKVKRAEEDLHRTKPNEDHKKRDEKDNK